MKNARDLLRTYGGGSVGLLVPIVGIALFLACAVAGSFLIEHFTSWPDVVTIGLMVVLLFFVPPVGFLVGLAGGVFLLLN